MAVNTHLTRREFSEEDLTKLNAFAKLLSVTLKNGQNHDVMAAKVAGITRTCDTLDESRGIFFEMEQAPLATIYGVI